MGTLAPKVTNGVRGIKIRRNEQVGVLRAELDHYKRVCVNNPSMGLFSSCGRPAAILL
jgi:hypothetical protein